MVTFRLTMTCNASVILLLSVLTPWVTSCPEFVPQMTPLIDTGLVFYTVAEYRSGKLSSCGSITIRNNRSVLLVKAYHSIDLDRTDPSYLQEIDLVYSETSNAFSSPRENL